MGDQGGAGAPIVLSSGSSSESDLAPAIKALSQGQLIVFPTDTVYGIGTNPTFELSIHRLYKTKKRDRSLPLTLHAADRQQALDYVSSFSKAAECLADVFWPGRLTLVLPRSEKVLPSMVGGFDTVGIRVPDHDVVRTIAHESGVPIAGTSANLSGSTTCTKVSYAMDDFGDAVDVYVDCGATTGGIESTVLDLTSKTPRIIRPGAVSATQMCEVLSRGGLPSEIEESGVLRSAKLLVHPGPRVVALVGSPEWAVTAGRRFIDDQQGPDAIWLLLSSGIVDHIGSIDGGLSSTGVVVKRVTEDNLYDTLRDAENRRIPEVIFVGTDGSEDALLVDRAVRRASSLQMEKE